MPALTDEEVPIVLDWILSVLESEGRSRSFDRIIPRLLAKVWESAERSGVVVSALADFFFEADFDGEIPRNTRPCPRVLRPSQPIERT